MKKIHILENTLRSVLLENRESKNINLARKFLKSHGYDDEQAQRTLDAIRTDMPNARLAQCKFLLGVVRLFLNKELADGNAIMKLNSYLPYIASDAHVNEYDNDLNGMSYDEIAERFRPMYTQDAEKSRKESNGKKRTVNTEYSIVRIPDFATASKYGDYTTWCVTHDDYAYNAYTSEGRGLFYFCLRKGFERVSRKVGEGCPLDEYGLSMISVSVTDEGEPNTITCRWNHDNGANDHVMSKDDLEDLLGVNFYEAFKPYTEDELLERGFYTVSMLRRWVSEGKDILTVCRNQQLTDKLYKCYLNGETFIIYNKELNQITPKNNIELIFVSNFVNNFAKISRQNDEFYSFINGNGQQICDWFWDVEDFQLISDNDSNKILLAKVQREDGKWSFINTQGKQICDWYYRVRKFYEGVAQVQREDGKWTFINTEGQQIGSWYKNARLFHNGFARVRREYDQWTFINTKGQQICDWYNYIEDFYNGFAQVQREDGKWSLINTQGKQICDWYKLISGPLSGFYKVQREDGMISLINSDGKQICDWYSPNTKFSIMSPNEIYDNNGNLIPLYNESYARLNHLVTEALYTSIRKYLLYN